MNGRVWGFVQCKQICILLDVGDGIRVSWVGDGHSAVPGFWVNDGAGVVLPSVRAPGLNRGKGLVTRSNGVCLGRVGARRSDGWECGGVLHGLVGRECGGSLHLDHFVFIRLDQGRGQARPARCLTG